MAYKKKKTKTKNKFIPDFMLLYNNVEKINSFHGKKKIKNYSLKKIIFYLNSQVFIVYIVLYIYCMYILLYICINLIGKSPFRSKWN